MRGPQGVDAAAMLCRRNGFDVFIEAVRHALEVQQLLQRRSRQCNMQRSACNMQRSACNIQIAPCSQQAVRTSQHRQAGACSGLLASCVLASRPRRVRFTTPFVRPALALSGTQWRNRSALPLAATVAPREHVALCAQVTSAAVRRPDVQQSSRTRSRACRIFNPNATPRRTLSPSSLYGPLRALTWAIPSTHMGGWKMLRMTDFRSVRSLLPSLATQTA